MIISVCGMGYTGSGAVKDFLKEYDNIQADDKLEFNLLYHVDGIRDLEYHLFDGHNRFMSADAAIKRFLKLVDLLDSPRGEYHTSTNGKFKKLSLDYIDAITQVKWKGHWDYDRLFVSQIERTIRYRFFSKIFPIFEKKREKDIHWCIDKDMYYSCRPNAFLSETQKYVNNILEAIGYRLDENLVLDQAVPFDNPIPYIRYFSDIRVIVVDKDPRDLFLLLKKTIRSAASWFPHDSVEEFCTYYRTMRSNAEIDSDKVLLVHFEDLVYQYDLATKRIMDFLELGMPDRQGTLFVPSLSKNNTRLFERYTGYEKQIEYIESNLKEYLYDFSKCPKVDGFGDSF